MPGPQTASSSSSSSSSSQHALAHWLSSTCGQVALSLTVAAALRATYRICAVLLSRDCNNNNNSDGGGAQGATWLARDREVVMACVRDAVCAWEERCLREVHMLRADDNDDGDTEATALHDMLHPRTLWHRYCCCCFFFRRRRRLCRRCTARTARQGAHEQQLLQLWRVHTTRNNNNNNNGDDTCASAHSMAFDESVPLCAYIELCDAAHSVLRHRRSWRPHHDDESDDDDRAWLRRLCVIVRYVVLRRLAAMDEARMYACLTARVLTRDGKSNATQQQQQQQHQQSCNCAAARLLRRPSWLVPFVAPHTTAPVHEQQQQADNGNNTATAHGATATGECDNNKSNNNSSSCSSRRCCCSSCAANAQPPQRFVVLPRSYLPIDSVLTYRAEHSWLRLLLHEHNVLPRWRRECLAAMRSTADALWRLQQPHATHDDVSSSSSSSNGNDRANDDEVAAAVWRWRVSAQTTVDYWFVRYACVLARRQQQCAATATRAFARQCLLHEEDDNEDNKDESEEQHDDVACACTHHMSCCHDTSSSSSSRQQQQQQHSRRHRRRRRRVLLLTLRAAVCAAQSLLHVCCPHVTLDSVLLMCVCSTATMTATTSMHDDVVRNNNNDDDKSSSSSARDVWCAARDQPQRVQRGQVMRHVVATLALQLLLSSVAAAALTVLQRGNAALRHALVTEMHTTLARRTRHALVCTDDAFLSRCVAPSSSSSPRPPHTRTCAGSNSNNDDDDDLCCASSSPPCRVCACDDVMLLHSTRGATASLHAHAHGTVPSFTTAATATAAHVDGVCVGTLLRHASEQALTLFDAAVSRYAAAAAAAVCVLLATSRSTAAAAACSGGGCVARRWHAVHTLVGGGGGSRLSQRIFLQLLCLSVCTAAVARGVVMACDDGDDAARASHIVVDGAVDAEAAARWLCVRVGVAYAANVERVLRRLSARREHTQQPQPQSEHDASAATTASHAALDADEVAMLSSRAAQRYLPSFFYDGGYSHHHCHCTNDDGNDDEDDDGGCAATYLFTPASRMLQRLLGLDVLFAYRAASARNAAAAATAAHDARERYAAALQTPLTMVITALLRAAAMTVAAVTVLHTCTRACDGGGGEGGGANDVVTTMLLCWADVTRWRCVAAPLATVLVDAMVTAATAATTTTTSPTRRASSWRRRLRDVLLSLLLDVPHSCAYELRAVQQLCGSLPSSTARDMAAASCAPCVVRRRRRLVRRWQQRQQRAEQPQSLQCDAAGRVVGGLRLRHGIALEHVCFAYPSTPPPSLFVTRHASDDADGAVDDDVADAANAATATTWLTLDDCTFSLPAHATSALNGGSGAGKSTALRLLQRMYDPLCIVAVDTATRRSDKDEAQQQQQQQAQQGGGRALSWSCATLQRVVALQLVASVLPSHTPTTATTGGDDDDDDREATARQHAADDDDSEDDVTASAAVGAAVRLWRRSGVWLDGLPLACLSTSYVRQLIACASQDAAATLDTRDTYLDALAGPATTSTSACVVVHEAEALRAAHIAQCDGLLARSPGGLRDGRVGARSGGERQCVALARVLAAALAHARHARLQRCLVDEAGDDASGDDAAAAAGAAAASSQAADVVLLLDEATSQVDAHTEWRMQCALQPLLTSAHRHHHNSSSGSAGDEDVSTRVRVPGRVMAVIVSHRLSTLRAATHMVVMQRGHVTMQGPTAYVCVHDHYTRTQARLQSLN